MTYKIFESHTKSADYFKKLVNQELIKDIIDMSLELLDEGCGISYSIRLDDRAIMIGHYQLKDNHISYDISPLEREYLIRSNELTKRWENWTNFKEEYFKKAKELSKTKPFEYLFRIYSIGESGDNRDYVADNRQLEVLDRIKGMYPDEIINIY